MEILWFGFVTPNARINNNNNKAYILIAISCQFKLITMIIPINVCYNLELHSVVLLKSSIYSDESPTDCFEQYRA